MKVSKEVVEQVAELSQLNIPENEINDVIESLNQVLALVEEMQSVDTTDVPVMANPLDATQTLRADKVTEPDQRGRFQEIAPDARDGLYVVPRVVE